MLILDKNYLHKINELHKLFSNEPIGVLINKPKDWTSFDVVAKIRNAFKFSKVGHCGTLDPFATGLMIVLINKGTKFQSFFQNFDKEYFATIKLGATTKTFDPTSEEENQTSIAHLNDSVIFEVLQSFVGKFEQVPPPFSAKKINGQRAYKLARNNQLPKLKPQQIEIYSIDNINISLPFVSFVVSCSKGTYIRSLANDVGNRLGVGAYLFDLKRTAIGDYKSDNALELEEFLNLKDIILVKHGNLL